MVLVLGCVFVFDFFRFLSLPGGGADLVEGGELIDDNGDNDDDKDDDKESEGEGAVVNNVPGTRTVTMPAWAAAASRTSLELTDVSDMLSLLIWLSVLIPKEST